jgi:hypothetical protein
MAPGKGGGVVTMTTQSFARKDFSQLRDFQKCPRLIIYFDYIMTLLQINLIQSYRHQSWSGVSRIIFPALFCKSVIHFSHVLPVAMPNVGVLQSDSGLAAETC